jgi:bleomycin hydrolase
MRKSKQETLSAVYRILSIHLGTPPVQFEWQWQDKDKEFHRDGVMTPQEFAEKYISVPIDEYVCLVHDPRPTSPYGKTYTVQYLGNVVGGEGIVTYLNVEIEQMKRLAAEAIVDGEPVWFGCDVEPSMRRDLGLWDTELFDFDTLYDAKVTLSKADRLLYGETFMTHAMLFTGVDMVDNQPRRWRVENSWGDEENGRKGFFMMSDNWFDEYMFEIAVRRDCLDDDQIAALDEPPIVLPPWDPMGALARGR